MTNIEIMKKITEQAKADIINSQKIFKKQNNEFDQLAAMTAELIEEQDTILDQLSDKTCYDVLKNI